MQNTLRNLILYGISVFEVILFYYLIISKVSSFERVNRKDICIMAVSAAFMGYISMFNRNVAFFSYISFGVVTMLMCVGIIIFEKKNITSKIVLGILYNELVALCDFFFAFLCIEIIGINFGEKMFLNSNSWWKLAIYILSRIIITILVVRVCKYQIDINEYKKTLLVISFVLMLLLNYFQFNMVRMLFDGQTLKGGQMGLALLFVLICVFVLSILSMKNQVIKKENEILVMREELLMESYLKLEKEIDNNRIFIHDFKHDLIMLGEYVNINDTENIRRCLNEMGANLNVQRTEIWTQNKVWDLVLQQKKQEAEQKGVSMNIHSMMISRFPFDEREGCSLFGNLLDNAIEACEKISGDNKYININIERNNHILLIEVENTIDNDLYKGILKTSKTNREIHGYGLKSVKRIIDKYEGVMAYHKKDNYFVIRLSFFDIENDVKENDYDRKKKRRLCW